MVPTQKIMFIIAGVFLSVLSLALVFKDNGVLALSEGRARLNQAIFENDELKAVNIALFHEVKRLKHDAVYQEYVVRRELGMIKPDEIIIKFHSDMKK